MAAPRNKVNQEPGAGAGTYAGTFMVALATLMYEILLTRIFSVTMWYHYSFMAISVAMFGMTAGAIVVYLLPNRYTAENAKRALAVNSLLFAISTVVCFVLHTKIPFVVNGDSPEWRWLALTYTVVSVPFVFSGISMCVALTRFPRQVGAVYAADLAGAALGCVALIYVLNLTDGPTAMFAVAVAAGLGATFFARGAGAGALKRTAAAATLALACFVAVNTVMISKGRPLIRLTWVKGGVESRASYEKWNSFSRIRVWGSVRRMEPPFGWGLSPAYPSHLRVRQLHMNIDAGAYTPIPEFKGDIRALEYLKYDVTNLAHYIRPGADVLVVGAGGGRDVLSALAFEQHSVKAIEINKDILDAVNVKFGRFTGHLDRLPNVIFVNDEARSYVRGRDERYDIIQVSLIDTWAATSAGAFVLAENSLYTVEAWTTFLERLKPGGVLTFSRWYFRDRPAEMYRLTSLAVASLARLGVRNPRRHIVIVRNLWMGHVRNQPHGVGTILVSPQPFSEKDLDTIGEVASNMKFDVVLSPRTALDANFAAIASGEGFARFVKRFPLDISPPTDDRPFFFNMLRPRDMFHSDLAEKAVLSFNMKAVSVLGYLLAIVLVLTGLCILLPLALTTRRDALRGTAPLFVYFAAIGLGFMFVEVSQMQRLVVFLGHPTYGLSVVLFSLLLSGGLGSLTTHRLTAVRGGRSVPRRPALGGGGPGASNAPAWEGPATPGAPEAVPRGASVGLHRSAAVRLLLLVCATVAFGLLAPHVTRAFLGAGTPARIAVAVIMLFPLGLLMGTAFPIGMKLASARSSAVTPWLWGLNGATSVCAAVLAVVVALSAGISAAFWLGSVCYAAGVAVLLAANRPK
jgi:hypothetical protein